MDANTYYLNKYMEQQAENDRKYEEMLADLRMSEPDEYEEIIDSYGFSDMDLADIINDL